MRIRIALALALCAAAAPLHAQRGDSVYHGAGYDLVLPARYRFLSTRDAAGNGYQLRTYVFGNNAGAVMVLRMGLSRELNDTSIATRRAVLQIMRAAMLQAAGNMRLDGEPAEIVRDDRVTLRTPVVFAADGRQVRTQMDLSVSRQGPVVAWMVLAVRVRPGPRDEEIAARALDSFRVTGVDGTDADEEDDASAVVSAGARSKSGDLGAKP
ncbi:hypothetical protein [Longimicrobium sp.]|uniref:hypothetical protein n=1 Tax=Longimicrobium sp. TaxID=2029185 RepID=UPI002BB62E3A|nr:hypothetical protein [Longimicrobium sp.]HSU16097.1 hypothetical protein [Longimicrobium sp.]